MSIVLARIDNRLIHGQVLEAWVPFTKADCLVVANDQVAGLALPRLLMESAVPQGIRVVIGTVDEVARWFVARELDAHRVLLLFATAGDALKAHRLGVEFAELNLGNMHAGEGKQRLSCTIALDQADIDHLCALERDGVRIVSRCIPVDRGQDWHLLIRQAGG